jgi:hypothetical protein
MRRNVIALSGGGNSGSVTAQGNTGHSVPVPQAGGCPMVTIEAMQEVLGGLAVANFDTQVGPGPQDSAIFICGFKSALGTGANGGVHEGVLTITCGDPYAKTYYGQLVGNGATRVSQSPDVYLVAGSKVPTAFAYQPDTTNGGCMILLAGAPVSKQGPIVRALKVAYNNLRAKA